MSDKQDLSSFSHAALSNLMKELNQPAFRAKQIEHWLYAIGCSSFDDMTNLPVGLRETLSGRFYIPTLEPVAIQESRDETRKYLFRLHDGACVESVGIPSSDGKRLTVCFSSQAGCPMGCTFCATGQAGFTRNLSPKEMVDQIRFISRDFDMRVSNVVCMGQGEPFLNYDAVLYALRQINSKGGLRIGARHITISTCGIVEGIRKLAKEPEQFTLAVSLHSGIQSTRDELMPGMANTSIAEIKDALEEYINSTNRRPSLEYTVVENLNDDQEHIDALVDFCKGMLCHVNLIPLNPISNQNGSTMTASQNIKHIADTLTAHGIENSIRRSRGSDIDGACGQLHNRLA